jgi:hypothetical protein
MLVKSKMIACKCLRVIILVLTVPVAAAPQAPAPRQNAFAPDGTPIALGLAGYAMARCRFQRART